MPEVSLQLFLSYSQKDEALRDELANHLSTLTRQGVRTQAITIQKQAAQLSHE
ncbi:hypothetical protein [Nostoc sp.]|uniref:hypothetical protein n=1 Tax=Nostoc sp. TaxID=1180 RepID=UPI002FF9F1FD